MHAKHSSTTEFMALGNVIFLRISVQRSLSIAKRHAFACCNHRLCSPSTFPRFLKSNKGICSSIFKESGKSQFPPPHPQKYSQNYTSTAVLCKIQQNCAWHDGFLMVVFVHLGRCPLEMRGRTGLKPVQLGGLRWAPPFSEGPHAIDFSWVVELLLIPGVDRRGLFWAPQTVGRSGLDCVGCFKCVIHKCI